MTAEAERESPQPLKKRPGGPLAAKRVATTLGAAAAAGLTRGKKAKRISGRAHETLFEAAAQRSGLDGSDLLEYALAKVALEDDFTEKLLALEGAVSRDVDLEF
jgi:hypothetical protein